VPSATPAALDMDEVGADNPLLANTLTAESMIALRLSWLFGLANLRIGEEALT